MQTRASRGMTGGSQGVTDTVDLSLSSTPMHIPVDSPVSLGRGWRWRIKKLR